MKKIFVLIWFLICNNLIAQDGQLNLVDGSTLKGTFESQNITLISKFGNLTIPFRDISKIEFGVHYLPNMEESINKAYSNLNNQNFKTREIATRDLIKFGRWSYPKIAKSSNFDDLELEKRVLKIKEELNNLLPAKHRIINEDKVYIGDSIILGNIKEESITIKTEYLGELKINLAYIENFNNTKLSKILKIDADGDSWLDTGILVEPGNFLRLKAKGTVDLWSATPGQFVCGPLGKQDTAGKGGTYKAGALVAKINNTEYLIGEESEIRTNEFGVLCLKIINSPWNNKSVGFYEVSISR